MGKSILVIGSSNSDMIAKVQRLPRPGETVMGSEFITAAGGKGANQAVAAARMGADVTFMACVADDSFGLKAIENYKKDNINTSLIKIEKGYHSGIAMINVSEDGNNSITIIPGANMRLLPKDIKSCQDAFDQAYSVLVQLEIPMETVEAIGKMAVKKNVPFILNPAPAAEISPGLLKTVSVLTPNETEAALLTGRTEVRDEDIPAMARELFAKGIPTVIITLGSNGVYLHDKDFQEYIPGYKVKAVDTTAAGDVFNGALAAALTGISDMRTAIIVAQRAAALSVTRMGAEPSIPTAQELEQHFDDIIG